MQLKKYLAKEGRGSASNLAENLGISLSYLSQLASGESSLSAKRCLAIEKATNGKVTRKD
jgi:DNA-binding transcriptional regulator YdaS (Cro superfamily)